MIMIHRILAISFLLVSAGVYSQDPSHDYTEELEHHNKAIENLKREIKATRERIERESKKEESTAAKIFNMEEEISLLDRLLMELKKEEQRTRHQIDIVELEMSVNQKELSALRDRYAKRVVYTYKQGAMSTLEKILKSNSWRQAVYRTRYLKIISEIEHQAQARINSLLINIGQNKLSLEAALRRSLSLKREQEKQRRSLEKKKISKEKELEKIRKNKVELANYIKEKEAGLQELEEVRKKILEDKARFERAERIRRQQQALKSRSFAELEGKLPWPAEGKVVAKFGRQWNPKLKTTTENPGIDIRGKGGSPIRSVLNGVITTITYIRGYGTTIIIDHGGGFYTVYSHVTHIETSMDSEVRAGDVIAYMGDSESVNGSLLHFEIWGKGQKLNPEQWLLRR